MKRAMTGLAMAAAMLWVAPAMAQTTTPTPHALELAARYVEISDLGGVMRQSMLGQQSLTDDWSAGLAGMMGGKGMEEPSAPMPSFVPETSFEGMEPFIALMEQVMTQAIAETYPEAELEALVTFYDTPQGRQILARQAALETRMTGLMIERMPEMMEAMGLGDMMDQLGQGMYGAAPNAPTRSMTPMTPQTLLPSQGGGLIPVIAEGDWLSGGY